MGDMMTATQRVEPNDTLVAPALSIDELVALQLTASELDTLSAYAWATGLSLLALVAKGVE